MRGGVLATGGLCLPSGEVLDGMESLLGEFHGPDEEAIRSFWLSLGCCVGAWRALMKGNAPIPDTQLVERHLRRLERIGAGEAYGYCAPSVSLHAEEGLVEVEFRAAGGTFPMGGVLVLSGEWGEKSEVVCDDYAAVVRGRVRYDVRSRGGTASRLDVLLVGHDPTWYDGRLHLPPIWSGSLFIGGGMRSPAGVRSARDS